MPEQLEPQSQLINVQQEQDLQKLPTDPFIAKKKKVINHLDAKRQGTLRVQLLTNTIPGGEKDAGELFTARYLMPFYGVTNVESNTKNNDYYNTQQSYGFWAVPDRGTKVLVIFVEGSVQPNVFG